jgi:hypothetical protein
MEHHAMNRYGGAEVTSAVDKGDCSSSISDLFSPLQAKGHVYLRDMKMGRFHTQNESCGEEKHIIKCTQIWFVLLLPEAFKFVNYLL